MPTRPVLARFLVTPENRSAVAAMQDVLLAVTSHDADRLPNPVYLHGPSGSGKTGLARAVADEVGACGSDVCVLSGNDFADLTDRADAREADLLVVEDLQHLPVRCVATLIEWLDERVAHGRPTVFTAAHGPSRLEHRGAALPRRLTSRLAAGLVVGIDPMQASSRRRWLQLLAERENVKLAGAILDWLAEHLRGGRQLEGAIRQLKALQRLQPKPLTLADIRAHFRTQIDAVMPTVQRITEHVCGYFQVPAKRMVSDRRSHDVLLPRQISMYLARRLTSLSLQSIGAYFGGRDHKTVQHACKKLEAAVKTDAQLSGVVRQLHADLT